MWGLNLVSKYKVWLIVGAAWLGTLGGAYLYGRQHQATADIETITKTIYVPVKEIQEVQVRNVERERELEEQLATSRNVARTLRARLDAVPVNSCAVDAGAVGVLNEAITGSPQADPAGVPVGATTTVTDLTDWALDATLQYNEVSTRYNALIDWVEEELIDDVHD